MLLAYREWLMVVIVSCAPILSNCTVAQASSFTLMSFNIRYDNPDDGENSWVSRKQSVISIIEKYKPDVLGLQEALWHQNVFIDDALSNYAYIGNARDDGSSQGEFCSIFYDSLKLRLINHNTFWLSLTPDKPSKSWDSALNRICSYGIFESKLTEDTIHVFNTHFDHIGKKARLQSSKLILNRIKEIDNLKSVVVLMGDLNASPNTYPIKAIQDYFKAKDNDEPSILGPKGTYNGFEIANTAVKRIDYVFLKNIKKYKLYQHLSERRTEVLFISDHYPVYVEFELNH